MVNPTDGTKMAPHGMFYMESGGGCPPELDAHSEFDPGSSLAETHQPSCFGQEEEKGSGWANQRGASNSVKNASRSSGLPGRSVQFGRMCACLLRLAPSW
jgi:hypothetical protein